MLRNDSDTMHWQRRMLAIYGLLLPILAPLAGFIAYDKNGPEFWYSISATFYATSNILMIGVLAVFAFFLWVYKGYDLGDSCTCKFSAAMAVGILVFPCKCEAAGDRTGILNLPTGVSNIFHCIIAALLFLSFAYMIGFRFTKTLRNRAMTHGKETRNLVYRICCGVIVFFMLVQVVTSILQIKWMTIINEAVMLWAFSFAWAVKSGLFAFLSDNPSKVQKH